MDILIQNGLIVDGTGRKPYAADVLIRRDRIADIGRFEPARARRTLDARGLVVAPGFIDGHTHSELTLLHNRQHPSAVYQGQSTIVTGQCGMGFAPLPPEQWEDTIRMHAGVFGDRRHQWPRWDSFASLLALLDGCAVNVGGNVSHNAVRQMALGFSDAPLTGRALGVALAALDTALAEGALGLSVGLCYYPGAYADTEELIELCRVVKARGGVFCVHHRLPAAYSGVEPLEEIKRVVRETGVRLNMLHYKTGGWADVESMLSPFDELLEAGADVRFEFYPYLVGAGFLLSLFPGWVQEGGYRAIVRRLRDPALRARLIADMEARYEVFFPGGATCRVVFAKDPYDANIGKTFLEIARERGETLAEMMIGLMLENDLILAFEGVEFQDEALSAKLYDDMHRLFSHPLYTVGSDAIPEGPLNHPRSWGAFPRVIRHMLDRGMAIERILPKITSEPAKLYRLKDRGVLAPGKFADVCLFDPGAIRDAATFENPRARAQGVHALLVNGIPALLDGTVTGMLPGRALEANA